MSSKQLIGVAVLACAAAGGAIWLGVRPHAPEATAAVAEPVTPAPHGAPGSVTTTPPARGHVQRIDRAARATLVDSIHELARRRETTTTSTSATTSPGEAPALPPHELDKEYIRSSMRDLIPMLSECYEAGLARDPTLAGKIVVDFTIEGEPGAGGVIGESKVDDQATEIADPQVRECIQETMYGLKIDPPPEGGIVRVRYPFSFRPAPPP